MTDQMPEPRFPRFPSGAAVKGVVAAADGQTGHAALATPTKRVSFGFTLLLCLANVALWMSLAPVSGLLLPTQISALVPTQSQQQNTLGLILGCGAFISIFSNAISGALSDRTTSRFGRRRPWLVSCAILAAGCLALLANAPSVAVLALGWGLYQLVANGLLSSLTAVVPDQVPLRQRGTVSAFVGLALPLALVLGSILIAKVVTSTSAGYYTLIAILLGVTFVFVLVLRDARLPKAATTPFHLVAFLRSFWINPREHPDFGWAWLTRFLVMLGYATGIGNFLLYYLKYAVHYEQLFPGHSAKEGVVTVQLISVALLLVSSVLGGVLSDRFARRKIFVIGSALLIALALGMLAISSAWTTVLIAAGVIGLGFGAYLAVDIALLTQVLTSDTNRGKDLGVLNIANALPQALAPLLAAGLLSISHNNYSVVFAAAACFTLLGSILVQRIKSVR